MGLKSQAVSGLFDFIPATLIGGGDATQLLGIQKTIEALENLMPNDVKLGAEDFGPFGSIIYWDKTYKTIKDNNQQLGISANLAKNIELITQNTYEDFIGIGGSIEDLTDTYQNFANLTSTNRLLNEDELEQMAKMRVALGEGFEEIFATFSLYGSSISNTSKLIDKAFIKANKMGINASKVLKSIRENIGLIDKFTFSKGLSGLEKMVMLSERYKLNMDSTSNAISGLNNLDSALEVSANLMTLGGDFSQLADPFSLMFEARNNPEKLMQQVVDLAGAYAYLDDKQGQFIVDPYAMDQIREFSKILNISTEEIVRASKIKGLENEINLNINPALKSLNDYDEILSKVATNAFFNQETKSFGLNINDGKGEIVFKSISEITQNDLNTLKVVNESEDVYRDLIQSNESLTGALNRLFDQFKRTIISDKLYNETNDFIQPLSNDARNTMETSELPKKIGEWFDTRQTGVVDYAKSNYDMFIKPLIDTNSMIYKWFNMTPTSLPIPTLQNKNTTTNNNQTSLNTSLISSQIKKKNEDYSFNNTSVNGKVDFAPINGSIDLTLNKEKIGEINIEEIINKIQPALESEMTKVIYKVSENKTRDNPKTGHLYG